MFMSKIDPRDTVSSRRVPSDEEIEVVLRAWDSPRCLDQMASPPLFFQSG